ncbi:MAG: T9SS type A sorting domain-containing protein [Bacteroidales bacterium]|nr:T9SS type A sorting domain-containing protein [Bacteroidales bacterium]
MKKNSNLTENFKFFILASIITFHFVLPSYGANWYIDNLATGANDGTSWENAWQSFSAFKNRINEIGPGDIVYISGGENSKTYREQLYIRNVHGDAENYATITVGQEPGHNGTVIITESDMYGIFMSGCSYIKLTGQVGSDPTPKIKVTGNTLTGVTINATQTSLLHHFDISYIEITENVINTEENPNNFRQSNALSVALPFDTDYYGEIHHLLIHNNNCQVEVSMYNDITNPTQFGTLKFHNNKVYDFHGDAMQVTGNEIDICENKICDIGEYQEPAHQDGIQLWGRYHRIYNNKFYNFIRPDGSAMANSYIRYNPEGPLVGDLYIYNNFFTETRQLNNDGLFRGLEISTTAQTTTDSCHNIAICNNIFSGIPSFSLFLGFATDNANGTSILSTDDVSIINLTNNIFYNTGTLNNESILLLNRGDGTITYGSYGDDVDVVIDYNCFYRSSTDFSGRITLDSGSGNVTYSIEEFKTATGCQEHDIDVTDNPLANHPQTAGEFDAAYFKPIENSSLIDAGFNISTIASFITTDIDGIVRPQGDEWDIGPYEYFEGMYSIDPKIKTIKVFPNPTEGILIVDFNNFEKAELYNLTGELVLTTKEKIFDISFFNRGIYVLKIYDKYGIYYSIKVLKSN